MTLRRFRVYVSDNTGGFIPDQVYLCSEVDALLKEAQELLRNAAPQRNSFDKMDGWVVRRDAFLKATETKP